MGSPSLLVPTAPVSLAADPGLSARVTQLRSSAIRDLLALTTSGEVLSLAGGIPPTELLPADAIAAATARVLAGDPAAVQYGPTEGFEPLRTWIAHHEVGDAASPVLVTNGSQQALGLVVEALIDPGAIIVTETPSYLGALQIFSGTGAQVVGAPTDRDGLDPAGIEALIAGGLRPRVCYLAPTFQNPTGSVMSVERRLALIDLAERHGFVIIDDDPYRELGFEAPPPRFAHLRPSDAVVSLGSFSKSLAPGLRVGWVAPPAWLWGPLVRLKQAADLHTNALSQRVVADLVARPGWLDGHTAGLRAVLAPRAGALVDALRDTFGERISVDEPRGGMFVWATWSHLPTTTEALLPRAIEHGVAFVPGATFDPPTAPGRSGDSRRSARLCFATLPPDSLVEAVARLDAVITSNE